MQVKVWDDWKSIAHTLVGVVAYFIPALFIVFLAYELVSFAYKRKHKQESVRDFIGDLIEFVFGTGVTALILNI